MFCDKRPLCSFVLTIGIISGMSASANDIPHQRVIIVGAGISGFGAASKLLENEISSFKILEAGDRIGGRINSVKIGEGYVDFGAEFVHGEKGNLIYELAKEYLQNHPEEPIYEAFHSEFGKVDDSLINDFFILLRDFATDPGLSNKSLCENFSRRYRSEILPRYKGNPIMEKIAREFEKTIEMIFLSIEGSFDWHVVRSKFHNFQVCPGNELGSWNGHGYKTIFEVLKKKIGAEKSRILDSNIILNKTVTGIVTKDKKIHVECRDGTKFTSDHLIFTASLGVLKHDHKKMFQPPLDEVKLRALHSLGIGAIMKIALLFEESWWKRKGEVFFIWSDEDERKLHQDVPYGPIKDGKHWLSSFHNIAPAPNNSRVVVAWIAGHLVPDVEQMSEDLLKKGLMYALKKFFGDDPTIPEPVSLQRSKWYSDPHFRGSFTYETLEVTRKNISPQNDLLEPITDETGVPRILFAGEATHPTRLSSADGSLSSGFMQAEKLVKHMKNQ